jgi:hypothetical protein
MSRIVANLSRSGATRNHSRAFATADASLRVKGSGAPSHRHPRLQLAAISCLAIAAAMALTAAPALASETHFYTGLSFGPDGTTATSFVDPEGLAVDQSSEVVYVYDSGAEKIYKFDAAGNPVNFSALGSNKLEGVGGFGSGEEELAVAPAGSPGGTAGDIYVANNFVVKIYAPSGTELGELSGGETCGVATNPAGHVFVGSWPSTVREYVPAANPVTNADQSGQSTASLPGICNVATDGLANVYAANFTGASFVKLEGLADASATSIEPGASTLAIDPASNDLYADRGSEVAWYSAAGTLIDIFGSGKLSESHGIAVNGTSGKVYANGSEGRAVVFGPPVVVPTVATTETTGIQARRAILHGTVNPEGVAVTECEFEYGTTTAYGETAPCVGSIPTDSSSHPVTAALTGLDPGTTYHFRIVAENANGPNSSADQTFETKKTAVTGTGTPVSGSKETLTGTVYPEGAPIGECRFEYGESASYGLSVGCAESSAQIGTGNGPVSVHAELPGLQPGTKYHFRLVAKSEALPQSEAGEDATFITHGPLIEGSAVEWNSITATAATLSAQINPNGEGTSYHVEYVTREAFEEGGFAGAQTAPAGANGIGHGESAVDVSPQLTGLNPSTEYRARFFATNVSGAAYSPTLAFATYPTQGLAGSCPANGAFRVGPSAALPDCRAYEQASPVSKDGSDIASTDYGVEASSAGDAITFVQAAPIPDSDFYSDTVVPYIARRGGGSWSTHGLTPPASYGLRGETASWPGDLSFALDVSRFAPTPGYIGIVRDNSDGSYTAFTPYTEVPPVLAGASADGSKVFVEGPGGVLPVDAGPAPTSSADNLYLYDRDSGQLSLAGILPESACGSPPCVPAEGSFAGSYDWVDDNLNTGGASGSSSGRFLTRDQHAVSESGDEAFFTERGTGQLYMREGLTGATPDTVQVNVSSDGTVDPNGQKPAAFLEAIPSGSLVFFTSCQKLTGDSTAVSTSENTCTTSEQGQDLYAFDSETHEVRDLTVDAGDPMGAQVQGVAGISTDGEYVYFVANGVLAGNQGAEGAHASLGNCGTKFGSWSGACNLYLAHAGSIAFITRLDASHGAAANNEVTADWSTRQPNSGEPPAFNQVSSDGHALLFRSTAQLTSYDNHGVAELYRYDVDSGLSCVSCAPTGAPPVGGLGLRAGVTLNHTGSSLPTFNASPYLTRNISASGEQVFFQTADKLVPADTNGDQSCPVNDHAIGNGPACEDAYEWEAPGAGYCVEGGPAYSPANGGCLYLLSAGTGAFPSYFGDASASGNDAFILTRSQLVPTDKDDLQDMYDVSVDGGLASQHPVSPPICEGEGCREAGTAAPTPAGAGTASFQGPGNPEPKHRSHKHHKKRHHKRSHRRTANSNRRAAR